MKWVANAIIAVSAILLLLIGMYLAVEDRTGSATIALSFGFLLVVMLLLAKFRRFKGFGFEAEMWEEKQVEAENLIERLKALSKSMVQQMAVYSANMGLVDLGTTIPIHHFDENLAQLRAILRQVEPDTSHDSELLAPLRNRIVRACCTQAARVMDRALSDELLRLATMASQDRADMEARPRRIGQITELRQAALLNRVENPDPAYISSLIGLMEGAPIPHEELDRLLRRLQMMQEELEFFVDHNAFRRDRKDKDYPWR